MSTIETLVNQYYSYISTKHVVGETFLKLQDVSQFVAPGRVEVSQGSVRKVTLGYFSFTAVDTVNKKLTGISPTNGSTDVALPAGAKVEQVFLDFTGSSGAQGPQGYQGSAGAAGVQGSQGGQGSQGPQGYQGANGSNGPQGYQGAAGSQGAQGSGGAAGSQGPQGYQGSAGAAGVQGSQGAQGSGVAAGSNTQVQYNNSGSFAGNGNLTFNSSTATLSIGSTTGTAFNAGATGSTNNAVGFMASLIPFSAVAQYGFFTSASSLSSSAVITGFGASISGSTTAYGVDVTVAGSSAYGIRSVGRALISGNDTSHDTLTLKAQTSQTGYLLACQNSSGTTNTFIDSAGSVRVGDSAYLQVRNSQTNFPAEIWGPVGSPTLRIANAVSTTYPNNAWRIYAVDGNGMARLESTRSGTIVYADTFQIENNYQEQRYAMNRVISSSNAEKVGHLFRCDFDSSMTGTSQPVACQILINNDGSTTTGVKKFLDCKTGGSSAFHVDKAGRMKIGVVASAPSDTPATGTMVFCSGDGKMYLYDGSAWKSWTPA